jgi:hypothetical protein
MRFAIFARFARSSCRAPALGVVALSCLLALGGLGQAPAAHAQQQIENGCMQEVYNQYNGAQTLNCTANDIQIAAVTNVNITDDGCAFAGDTVTFDATLEVLLTAEDRHDIGIYIAQDGGDALTGDCLVTILPYTPSNENCTAASTPYACCTGSGTGTCDFVDLDQTGDTGTGCSNDNSVPCNDNGDCPPGGTCVALGPGIQDLCGDIADSGDPRNPVFHDVTDITVTCLDANNDGFLDIAACTSWRQPGANDLCLSPLYAFPGNASKCRCDEALDIAIEVPKTIEACKVTVPADDPGRFDLQIAGAVEFTDAANARSARPPGRARRLRPTRPTSRAWTGWAGARPIPRFTAPSMRCATPQTPGTRVT